jgi:acyl phosphate:glycerol-3-phosphate acyltransferase
VRLGVLTLLGDALKGLAPVVLARYAAPDVVGAVAVAAVLGHSFPVFAAFRGGKGVATGLGALLALCPVAAGLSAMAFVGVVLGCGYVSVGSMSAAIIASPIVWWLGAPRTTIAAVVAIATVIVVRHRENITRLVAGREPNVHLPKRQALHDK